MHEMDSAAGEAATPAPRRRTRHRRRVRQDVLERALTWALVVLTAATVSLAGYFGYYVWEAERTERLSGPALRVIEDMRRAAKANPKNAAVHVRLGEALADAGLVQEAVRHLEAAVRIDPKHSGAFLDLGVIAMNRGSRRKARGYFEKVLELTEDSPYAGINQRRETALYNLGVLSMQVRDYDEAIGYLKGAQRIRRDASDTYYLLAECFYRMDRIDAARQQLDIALAFDPRFANAHYLMGMTFLKEGDKATAAEELRLAADYAPTAEQPKRELRALGPSSRWEREAREAFAKDDVTPALYAARLWHALEPKEPSAAKMRAALLERSGDKRHALDVYRIAAELSPKDAAVKAAIRRLSKSEGGGK